MELMVEMDEFLKRWLFLIIELSRTVFVSEMSMIVSLSTSPTMVP